MKNVAGYCRVSTAQQANDGTSLDEQEKSIREKCKKEGYELVELYSDGGSSGGSLDRPELQRLIKDAKDNKFDAVLFTKLDRLGRNNRDIHNLYHTLNEDCKIDLLCIEDPSVNTDGKAGKLILALMAGFAEFERETIRERTSAGRMAKWRKGEVTIGELPYGYKKGNSPGKIEVAEDQAAVYEKIVSYYLDQRLSIKSIAMQLNSEGVPTPPESKGQKLKNKTGLWCSKTISNILKKPAYKGEATYNKKIFESRKGGKRGRYMVVGKGEKPQERHICIKFPPLISPDRWSQIQQRIEQQKLKPKRIHKGYEDHFMLDGFVKCGECGSKIIKRMKVEKNGKRRFYYCCYWVTAGNQQRAISGRKPCHLKSSDADKVDSVVFSQIMEILTRPDEFAQTWLKDLNLDELEKKVGQLTRREKELSQQIMEGFRYIKSTSNPVLKEKYVAKQKEDEALWQTIRDELEKTKNEYDLAINKKDRFDQFAQGLNKKGIEGHIKSVFETKALFKGFLHSLPFAEKKRIVEAVVCPENGGHFEISYIRPVDFLGPEEMEGMTEAEMIKPLKDRDLAIIGKFTIDLNRIEKIILSLDRSILKEYMSPY